MKIWEMSVTVIATGFSDVNIPGPSNAKLTYAGKFTNNKNEKHPITSGLSGRNDNVQNEILNSAKKETRPGQAADFDDDDDTFYDIMSIFNKK